MKILALALLLSTFAFEAVAQTDSTAAMKKGETSISHQFGMGALQVGAATVGFVGPMMILMPKFVDSEIVRNSSFLLLPLSVSVAGLLYGTNLVGELMGGEDHYTATFLGAAMGLVVGTRGWTNHSSRTVRYLHFSGPIIAGGVSFYWLANLVLPSASIQPYFESNGGAGLQVGFKL